MKKLTGISTLMIFALFIISCQNNTEINNATHFDLKIKNGAYYINGEKTFINALGYEIAARPGQHPYEDEKELEIARMKNDLKVIKEAGFNAIRTWSELTEEEVQLVQESGLMLVYGIWILPDGDFDDPAFVDSAKMQVRDVMSWSKNYDCIITYLIMNEPMVAHIHEKGAKNTVDLWTSLRDIIHEEHPGIPVTISNNSAIGEYINERIFDVYGFNTYDYHEGLPGFTQGFANHFKYLKTINGENKPLLVTEFGMSVSPIGYGLYGGNTRERQAAHIIQNFSDLLDAGVDGICPFYYADGWWKAGNPAKHDPYPEEWFGYWGYADDADTIGHPRPIWYEFKEYNQAILAAPRNQQIYEGKVPIELYLNKEVNQVKAVYNDKVVFEKTTDANHFTGEIDFKETGITDREMVFEFYNANGELLKWESVMILTVAEKIKLPEIQLSFNQKDLSKTKKLRVTYALSKDTLFTWNSDLKMVYSHHEGWNPGEHRTKEVPAEEKTFTYTDQFNFSDNCYVLTVGAGIDIKYGKFVKRIHNEDILYRGNWAEAIKVN